METRNIIDTPKALFELHDLFVASGYELWFVGGCVRDSLLGLAPKDIDLTTSATPDEQIALYQRNGLRYIETGLQHGTVTVVLDGEPYEITTYRVDAETDGRHAVVEFTRDLEQDLFRRDLTINAIAMGFDGTIFDPFDGVSDIEDGVIKFVGNAQDRIQEDYLRILRFFRFYGRFGKVEVDTQTLQAIQENSKGLEQISVERIWMEMSKIISASDYNKTIAALRMMQDTGVLDAIEFPAYSEEMLVKAIKGTQDPVFVLGMMAPDRVEYVGDQWKWSRDERDKAMFIKHAGFTVYTEAEVKRALVIGVERDWMMAVLQVQAVEFIDRVKIWEVPSFPVSGNDLINIGFKPGPEMGRVLNKMKESWIQSDYSLDKSKLMALTAFAS